MKFSKLLPDEQARAEALSAYAASKKASKNPSSYYTWANGNEVLQFLKDMVAAKKERFEVHAHKVGLSPTSLRIKLYDGRKYMQDHFKDIADEDYDLLERMHVTSTTIGAVVTINPVVPKKGTLSDLLTTGTVIEDPTGMSLDQIKVMFLDFLGTLECAEPTLNLKGLDLSDDEVVWFQDILDGHVSESIKDGFMGTISKTEIFVMDMRHPTNQLQLGIPTEEKKSE